MYASAPRTAARVTSTAMRIGSGRLGGRSRDTTIHVATVVTSRATSDSPNGPMNAGALVAAPTSPKERPLLPDARTRGPAPGPGRATSQKSPRTRNTVPTMKPAQVSTGFSGSPSANAATDNAPTIAHGAAAPARN